MDKVSLPYLFSFSKYQAKCVIKFLFRQLMTSKALRFIFYQPLEQWLTVEKIRGRKKDKNSDILRTKRAFIWNKKHFP